MRGGPALSGWCPSDRVCQGVAGRFGAAPAGSKPWPVATWARLSPTGCDPPGRSGLGRACRAGDAPSGRDRPVRPASGLPDDPRTRPPSGVHIGRTSHPSTQGRACRTGDVPSGRDRPVRPASYLSDDPRTRPRSGVPVGSGSLLSGQPAQGRACRAGDVSSGRDRPVRRTSGLSNQPRTRPPSGDPFGPGSRSSSLPAQGRVCGAKGV